jgi:fatty-acyl-CoA synthase
MALLRIGVNIIFFPSSEKKVEDVIGIVKLTNSRGIIICGSTELMTGLQSFTTSSKVVWIDAVHDGVCNQGYSHYNDLLESGAQLDVNEVLNEQKQVQFDDPVVVLFTSGSTGNRKGAQQTNHGLVNRSIITAVNSFGIEADQEGKEVEYRIFSDRPFSWSTCQYLGINLVLSMGCTLICIPPMKSVKLCDAEFVLNVLQNERCTNATLMTYSILDIINHPHVNKYDLSSLKLVITGGQNIKRHILKTLKSVLPHVKIFEGYGLTEIVQVADRRHDIGEDGDAGLQLLPNNELKIVDNNNCLVLIGDVGEICVRSTPSFLGYFEDPEATSQAISPTGWFRTGDLGYINRSGKLMISGRTFDIIKRAVDKIAPAAVEKVLIEYPGVKDVVVVGVPDVRLGEELCACVVAKNRNILESSRTEFEEWMTQQWSVDQQGLSLKPKYVLVVEEFPQTNTGKTDRKALRVDAARKLGIELD